MSPTFEIGRTTVKLACQTAELGIRTRADAWSIRPIHSLLWNQINKQTLTPAITDQQDTNHVEAHSSSVSTVDRQHDTRPEHHLSLSVNLKPSLHFLCPKFSEFSMQEAEEQGMSPRGLKF